MDRSEDERTTSPEHVVAPESVEARGAADNIVNETKDKHSDASGSAEAPLPLAKKINDLKQQQAAMLAERKRITKDLRNLEKRRKRLKTNARRLSDEDLAEVMRLRQHSKGTEESGEVQKPKGKTGEASIVESRST